MKRKTVPSKYYEILESIGSLIREYRLSNNYSQIELSQNLNVHRNTLSHIENGRNVNLLSLIEIAETLEIDLKDLFSDIR
jgi:transcriptional regulator with XRE-family HTH domain